MKEVMMAKGAKKVVEYCANLQPNERVLIVTDFPQQHVAKCVAEAAYRITDQVSVITMPPREVDGQQPTQCVVDAMTGADVMFMPVTRSITHAPAVKAALQRGARVLSMTAFSDDMFIFGGIEADFEALAARCKKMGEIWSAGSKIHLTTPGGTDLTADISGRPGNAHTGLARNPGEFTTCPDIESSVSPVTGSAEGIIVADASIPYFEIGVLSEPVKFMVEKGKVVNVEGGKQAQKIKYMMDKQHNEAVYNIAQIAVGLNPHCRICGLDLEDEGTYGTAHIGIGTSTLIGGEILAPMHFDGLMYKQTLVIDGETIFKDGEALYKY
ncbi:MAG: leucyl aminopeptidase [Synergistaceae bacterium]|nr:leucyl aminopeptidase [Synergistaceae bacterium]